MTYKKVAFFGARGEIHGHLGTCVLPKECLGVANHAKLCKYYIVQLIQNQISLSIFIAENIIQHTIAVAIQPQTVPLCVTAI